MCKTSILQNRSVDLSLVAKKTQIQYWRLQGYMLFRYTACQAFFNALSLWVINRQPSTTQPAPNLSQFAHPNSTISQHNLSPILLPIRKGPAQIHAMNYTGRLGGYQNHLCHHRGNHKGFPQDLTTSKSNRCMQDILYVIKAEITQPT